MRPNIAILLAGGVGARMGADQPKQLLTIAGKTVLEHSLAAFEACPLIDAIAIVVHPSCEAATQ
ncbi:MAG: 2-C-methyl-D-erythritol 4-phosphate cytidylyltransferase, partial [Bacteroidaceae bacterium]|nr:2-C-methyl-D-erythritol 4-phosphate cytidylyltransferase [Bacteroidaceae bacterium]